MWEELKGRAYAIGNRPLQIKIAKVIKKNKMEAGLTTYIIRTKF